MASIPQHLPTIIAVNHENFQKEVLESKLPVVVDAYATWCPPCKMMAPICAETAKSLEGRVKFVQFNVDEDQKLAERLNVQAMPTFKFYQHGQCIDTKVGCLSKEDFQNRIEKIFQLTNEIQ